MIKKTAIVGMGALGLLYADQIASFQGKESVSFVMDRERMEKYSGTVFACNGVEKRFQMVEDTKATPADLVIVAVKYNGLSSALDTMRGCIGEHTVIMSVMNGIDSEEKIAQRYGSNHMIYTVAQGMDAMKFGSKLTYTKMGELRIGVILEEQKKNLETVKEFFDEIRMPYTIEEDILYRIWGKFMLNVGINQTCLAFETNYGGTLKENSEENKTMLAAMREVITLANAKGIPLSEKDLEYYIEIVKTLLPEGMPSMRQDGVAHRYSEVEMFAGTVKRLAAEYGIQTPANDFLYNRIKEIEAQY